MTSKIVVNNIEPDAGISTVTVVGNVESTKFVGAVEGSVTGNVTGNLTGTASTSTNAATAYAIDSAASLNTSGIVTATSFVPTVGQLSHRNKVINGAMNIRQRAASENNISASGYYVADRFNINMVNVGSFRVNLFQSSQSPDGFNNSLGVSIGTGTAGAIASSERVSLEQRIESQNLQDLAFGTSAAKSFTLSFYVRSSRTGQYGINMRQHDSGKDYNEKFDISSANTWERKIITVTGNTGDTFADDNGIGLWFRIMLRAGSNSVGNVNYQSWGSSDDDKAPTGQQTTWGTDASDDFYLTGVQLEVGSVATPFEHISVDDELRRCRRYFFKTSRWMGGARGSSTGRNFTLDFGMRLTGSDVSSGTYTNSATTEGDIVYIGTNATRQASNVNANSLAFSSSTNSQQMSAGVTVGYSIGSGDNGIVTGLYIAGFSMDHEL